NLHRLGIAILVRQSRLRLRISDHRASAVAWRTRGNRAERSLDAADLAVVPLQCRLCNSAPAQEWHGKAFRGIYWPKPGARCADGRFVDGGYCILRLRRAAPGRAGHLAWMGDSYVRNSAYRERLRRAHRRMEAGAPESQAAARLGSLSVAAGNRGPGLCESLPMRSHCGLLKQAEDVPGPKQAPGRHPIAHV